MLAVVFVVNSLDDQSFLLVDYCSNEDDHHFVREVGVVVDFDQLWEQLLDVGQIIEMIAKQDLLPLVGVEDIVDPFSEFDHHSIIGPCAFHRYEEVGILVL